MQWHNAKRKEHYGIIARAIKDKEGLREKGCLAYDLEDFEVLLTAKRFIKRATEQYTWSSP